MPFEDFPTLITWIIQSGGAGFLSYWLLARMQEAGWLKKLSGPWLRVLAFVQAAVIGLGTAYLGGVLKIYPYPETLLDVLNLILIVGGPAVGIQQLTHGFLELPSKTNQPKNALPTMTD